MFNHGVSYIDLHRPTAKILHVQCLCGEAFYPDGNSAFADFNRHIEKKHEQLLQAHLELNVNPRR
ncbi:MAG: hypothetical protein JWN14_796 [Chthonomonadales bacterium]|nr:hypothetical protein [Chthonomonadales bacterium]